MTVEFRVSDDALKAEADKEALAWSRRSYETTETDLSRAVGYDKLNEFGILWFEVLLLERERNDLHVAVNCDDASERWTRSPVSTSFLLYRNGEVDI